MEANGFGQSANHAMVASNPTVQNIDNSTPSCAGLKQEVFALDSGQIVVSWPEQINPQSFEDVKDWLTILERKIGRCVKQNDP